MKRTRHGQTSQFEIREAATAEVNCFSANINAVSGIVTPVVPVTIANKTGFNFLFPELQLNASYLSPGVPESEEGIKTEDALKNLGDTMRDPGLPNPPVKGIPDSGIPSAYTYFGQFVGHDITFEKVEDGVILNLRSPKLDLDSVYGEGSVPPQDNLMKLGFVSPSPGGRVPGKDDENDLPRDNKKAQIADPRNDENLIIAQLHVAFLRAHNNAVKKLGLDFNEARTFIRQHYQWIVLEDYLKKIADPDIVNKTKKKNSFFFPKEPLFMPMEFSAAAYRFGHSMVRSGYNRFNKIHSSAPITTLFTFTGFGGFGQQNSKTLPEDWIIDWKSFVNVGERFNRARPIDTTIVNELFTMSTEHLNDLPGEGRLSVRNLLKGYERNLPTGQAVARRMELKPLTKEDIQSVAESVSPAQLAAVNASQFTTHTPLWYYILAEAAHGKKDHLGQVGSTVVAEVLIEILRRSEDSILGPKYTKEYPWRPDPRISTDGEFDLSDFLRFAGVL